MFSLIDQKRGVSEEKKLTANYANGLAIGVAIVGGFAPIFNTSDSGTPLLVSIVSPLIAFWGSAYLHVQARRFLGDR